LPVAELLSYAQQQAAKLAALPATSIRATKRLMKANQTAPVYAQIVEESKYFAELLVSPEAKEAFAAFLEKRKPDFTKFS